MTINVTCPYCKKLVKAPPEVSGQVRPCPNCKQMIQFPQSAPTGAPATMDHENVLESGGSGDLEISCPKCKELVAIPESLLGQAVLCPTCDHEMVAPSRGRATPGPATISQPVAAPPGPAPQPNKETIQTITPLSDPKAKEKDKSKEREKAKAAEVGIRGSVHPKVTMMEGEKVLEAYTPKGLELGILAWFMGARAKLVLTNQRVFVYSRGVMGRMYGHGTSAVPFPYFTNVVESYRVSSIKGAHVGKTVNLLMLLCSLLSLAGGVVLLLAKLGTFGIVGGTFGLLTAVQLFFYASEHRLMLCVEGGLFIGLRLNRMRSDEATRFVTKLLQLLQERKK